MSDERGFTLTELVIAMSLSSLVLIGLMSVATAVVRSHVGAIRKGEANAVTLYSVTQMNRELELATHIQTGYPSVGMPPAAGGNDLRGCTNWSRYMNGGTLSASGGGPIDPSQPSRYFVYCVRTESSDANEYRVDTSPERALEQFSLFRHEGPGCPDLGALSVTCGTPGAGETVNAVVMNRMYDIGGPPTAGTIRNLFGRTAERKLVVRLMVGANVATRKQTVPQFFIVDTTVTPEKSYLPPND